MELKRPGSFVSPDSANLGETAIELTSYILHKHYCENDVEAIIETFDEDSCFSWFGAAEHEHAVGSNTVASIFRQFAGKVPTCILSDERYEFIEPAPGVVLCTGTLWIATDPSTQVYLRVHQRVTAGYRVVGSILKCFHIHISNPYTEMAPDDVGFPTKMAKHSYEYLQEVIKEQTRQLEEQSTELSSIYSTAPCAIMRFLRTESGYEPLMFNPAVADLIGARLEDVLELDWSRGHYERLSEASAQLACDRLARLVNLGDRMEMTFEMEKLNGDVVYVSSNNELVGKDARGDIIQKIVFDVSERVALEKALEKQSFEDGLTGLFNRNKFNQEMSDAQYQQADHLGIAYFDINGLKETNDRNGHRAGDALICQAAKRIKAQFPNKAYRIGGDEFVVIDTQLDQAAFEQAVQNAYAALKQDGISIAVGLSFRNGECDVEAQFDSADKRMYKDKARHYQNERYDRRRR